MGSSCSVPIAQISRKNESLPNSLTSVEQHFGHENNKLTSETEELPSRSLQLESSAAMAAEAQEASGRLHSVSTPMEGSHHSFVGKLTATPPRESTPSVFKSEESALVSQGGSQYSAAHEAAQEYIAKDLLSRRAIRIVERVDSITAKCEGTSSSAPTNDERAMFDLIKGLRSCSIGILFLAHPEVLLSNRSAVIATPDFNQDEVVGSFRLCGAYGPGTVGRSFLATKLSHRMTDGDQGKAVSKAGRRYPRKARSFDKKEGHPMEELRILKVVSFLLRKSLMEAVVAEQRILVNINYDSVLKQNDVLNDEYKENMIVITNYHPHGNISRYAGCLDDDPDKLRRILHEVGVGLRILHSHEIYHHNLKLSNVLETANEHYCIADAGFSLLFTMQCPEALVFNGELACLPPEVFDESGSYVNGSIDLVSSPAYDDQRSVTASISGISDLRATTGDGKRGTISGVNSPVAKVDIWGFGLLMYRLAYGKDPVDIAECSFDEVRTKIEAFELTFPPRKWTFAADLEEVIAWCLEKDAGSRPSIVKLLRHPFFRGCQVQSFSFARTVSSAGLGAPSGLVSPLSTTGFGGNQMTSAARIRKRCGYTVDSILGVGQRSETLLVHLRRNPTKHFAFKLVSDCALVAFRNNADPKYASWLRTQLATIRKLRHPNILSITDIVDNKQDGCCVVEDFMPKGCLRQMPPLVTNEQDSRMDLRDLLAQVLCGLVYLHDNGIAHLSLRPSNIFLDGDGTRFRLADYGPLFMTAEILADEQKKGSPIYSLPPRLQQNLVTKRFSIDCFCVGLLAASVIPEVYATAWEQLKCAPGAAPLDVTRLLHIISHARSSGLLALPSELINFIHKALCQDVTARQLLFHPYFQNKFSEQNVPVQKVKVSPEEVKQAMRPKSRACDETRLLNVIGQDPIQESIMLGSLADCPAAASNADANNESISATLAERSTSFHFKGANIICGQCHAEILIALYLCQKCDQYVRCGKCAVNDHHQPEHELLPFIIHTIERGEDGENTAILFPPACIPDVHALETLEMGANFPVGALTNQLASQRALDRSLARSITTMGFNKPQTELGSVSQAHDADKSISVSTVNGKRYNSLMPSSSAIAATSTGGSSKGGLSTQDEAACPAPGAPSPPKLGGLLLKGTAKKLALPKAEEMDDGTWQQELERCRERNMTELLLYSYNLQEIPVEVYSPPLLQVVFLDVSQNDLTSIPHELSFLVNLRKLVLSSNKLKELPDSLGNLSLLETLDLSHNFFTDLPQTFIYLTNLTSIAMDYNNCSGIPESLLDITSVPPVAESLALSNSPWMPGVQRGSAQNSLSIDAASSTPPRLDVIYLAFNDQITAFPNVERLRRFRDLKIALDNEPSLYAYYTQNNIDSTLPNVTINWNKIYPDKIIPYLFCGSLRSAQSQKVYRRLNITYVLTVGRKLIPVPPENGKHKVIVVDDIPGADILSSFAEAVDFIEESQRKGQGCLVHCFAGLSRSATTVIAYLMIKKNMRLDEAYLITKKGRPAILPNKGFFEQLLTLDHQLYPNAKRPLDLQALGRPDDTGKSDED